MEMKKYLAGGLICLALLAFSGSAWSLTITDGTDVGGIDTLLAETNLGNSSETEELAWVDGIVPGDVVFGAKTEFGDGSGETPYTAWMGVEDNLGVYAFNLFANGGYFLVKTGNNGTTTSRYFLFENLPDTSYAVIDLDVLGITDLNNIEKVSHLSEFNRVSEPGTLLLLGSGLLGLGLMRRRKTANA